MENCKVNKKSIRKTLSSFSANKNYLLTKISHRNQGKKIFELINKDVIKSEGVYISEVKEYYSKYGFNVNPNWHLIYSCSNSNKSTKYIPDDIWYGKMGLLSFLNRQEYALPYSDKNILDKLLVVNIPETLLRKINSFYLSSSYEEISSEEIIKLLKEKICTHKKIVIKPTTDTSGGKGVLVTESASKAFEYLESLTDGIVQPYLIQHNNLSALNPSSVNTIRVMTYLDKDEVKLVSSYLRIGKKGSTVDNMEAGGIAVGLECDGTIRNKGYDKDLKEVILQTEKNVILKIPNYIKTINLCKSQHAKLPWFKVLSWDIAIDQTENPIFLEYNIAAQGIFGHQLTNGPLFQDFTDELLINYKDYLKEQGIRYIK